MSAAWKPGETGSGLCLDGLALSFQRFAMPPAGIVADHPRSLGALPVAAPPDGRVFLPVGDQEAFWIGISSNGPGSYWLRVRLDLGGDADVDIAEGGLSVPPPSRIDGWRRDDGPLLALSRRRYGDVGPIRALRIEAQRYELPETMREVVLELVDYSNFARLASRPAPELLDPAAGYQGCRLP